MSLGKRKERTEEESKDFHGSTLFISNLPYTATSVDLETLFSDLAPVRTAFVVTDAGISKGVGYVSFAAREDAERVVLDHGGDASQPLDLAGRKLRLQWADQKPKEKKVKTATDPATAPAPRPRPAAAVARTSIPHDPDAIRTLIVSGIPPSTDSKALWKKFRKQPGAEKVVWPVDNDETTAHVVFATPSSAMDATPKLHAHIYKGSLLSVTLKKRLAASASTSTSKTLKPNHASRLIVRNVPFDVSEQDLRAVFLPFGPIHSIDIPHTEENKGKGFAFVWMISKKDAEKAMEGTNGKPLKAGIAKELREDKTTKKKLLREQRKLEKAAKPDEQGVDVNDDEQDVEEKPGRKMAVDWALSKDRWEEEKQKEAESSASGSSSEDESGSDEGSSDSEEDSNSEPEDDDDDSDNSEVDRDGDDEPVKPTLPEPAAGTTLFIRNVPFSSTEEDLRTLFRQFGPLRYARITMDPFSGRSRGTGFACYWNKEDADKVVEQSELVRNETSALAGPKKNPFALPSILTADPSSSMAASLVLDGRTLDVVRAVTRDVAGKLREDGERAREKKDKRNMYLLREGVILPNSPAASQLGEADLERRQASFSQRKQLLHSNPSLYISKTRLSIRQIPLSVSERMLKRMAGHAIKDFESQVKAGTREALSTDELRADEDENDIDVEQKTKVSTKKGIVLKPKVIQSKIVRASERVDALTGKGRSKGYGFLQMSTHADALRVLRYANNNPELNVLFDGWWKEELTDLVKTEKDEEKKQRLKMELAKPAAASTGKKAGTMIIEFSIENVQVVQRRQTKSEQQTQKRQKQDEENSVASEPPKKKSRKVQEAEAVAESKPSLGSLIGRKRKERKSAKSRK